VGAQDDLQSLRNEERGDMNEERKQMRVMHQCDKLTVIFSLLSSGWGETRKAEKTGQKS
jgi:hypothetical protein